MHCGSLIFPLQCTHDPVRAVFPESCAWLLVAATPSLHTVTKGGLLMRLQNWAVWNILKEEVGGGLGCSSVRRTEKSSSVTSIIMLDCWRPSSLMKSTSLAAPVTTTNNPKGSKRRPQTEKKSVYLSQVEQFLITVTLPRCMHSLLTYALRLIVVIGIYVEIESRD